MASLLPKALPAVVLLALVACQPPAGPQTAGLQDAASPPPVFDATKVASERAVNQAAYGEHIGSNRESLIQRHLGDWVVIAGGRVFPGNAQRTAVAPAATMQAAVAAADREVPDAQHRFVFRIGEEGDFQQILGGAELRHVVGNGFVAELQLAGVALGSIGPHGRLFAGNGAEITVAGPDDRMFVRPEVGVPGAVGRAEATYVISSGFGGTAVMPPQTAASLSLHRWEIPGKVTLEAFAQVGGDCHRARARFRFPGTSLDFTVPVAIWSR